MRPSGSRPLRASLWRAFPCLGLAYVLALAACAGSPAATAPVRPAPILHLVYFQLVDPAQAPTLIADCQSYLSGIPGVLAFATGTHLDTGRDAVDGDYDVALLVGFADVEAYQAYLVDESHLKLLARWKDGLESYRIHDIVDRPSDRPSDQPQPRSGR